MAKIKIDKKIVGYRVESADDKSAAHKASQKASLKAGQKADQRPDEGAVGKRLSVEGNVVRMHEKLERPEMLPLTSQVLAIEVLERNEGVHRWPGRGIDHPSHMWMVHPLGRLGDEARSALGGMGGTAPQAGMHDLPGGRQSGKQGMVSAHMGIGEAAAAGFL